MALVTFIVNGQEAPVEIDEDEPLLIAKIKALKATFNTGRPHEDFETRIESGERLSDLMTTIGNYGLDGQRVYITLALGMGGAKPVPTLVLY